MKHSSEHPLRGSVHVMVLAWLLEEDLFIVITGPFQPPHSVKRALLRPGMLVHITTTHSLVYKAHLWLECLCEAVRRSSVDARVQLCVKAPTSIARQWQAGQVTCHPRHGTCSISRPLILRIRNESMHAKRVLDGRHLVK
jgi:hypothetical protein